MIAIDRVSLTYNQENAKVDVLRNITMEVAAGENLVIIGPSGCGKSSLLFLMAGLLKPTQGTVTVAGEPLSKPRANTALILQEYGLFPWKTVMQNVVLGLEIRGLSKAERTARTSPILAELGLSDLIHHYPGQLSGGQRQRVAVARALAMGPDLLLMDEPFSSLDALTRENLQNLLIGIRQERKLTTVMVTHSIEEAVFLGQKIAIFSPRPAFVSNILDNSKAGDPDYRADPDFYCCCARVREMLELGHR